MQEEGDCDMGNVVSKGTTQTILLGHSHSSRTNKPQWNIADMNLNNTMKSATPTLQASRVKTTVTQLRQCHHSKQEN